MTDNICDPSALWRPNQLQLIVFPATSAINLNQDWWNQIAGQEPGETVKKRNEITASGNHGDANLILNIDVLRIAWTLSPRLDPDNPPATLPIVGVYPDARNSFATLMNIWLASYCPDIKRMAFTGILIQEADSHEDAYVKMRHYLEKTVKVDPKSTDFTYRVNRPRRATSSVDSLMINRLTTWSAAKFSISAHSFYIGKEPRASSVQLSDFQYGTLLHFDINTDADRIDAIPHESLGAIFSELIDHANTIASHGDVP